MLGAFSVLLAVATAATHFGVSSDSACSVIGKFFSLLSNVFPFRAASLGLQATFGLGPKNRGCHRRVVDSAFAQAVDGACDRPAGCPWIVDAMHGHSRQPILAKV